MDRRKTNKVNFEIPKLATSTFWKLAQSLENSAKKKNSMEVKKAEVIKVRLLTTYMLKETKAKFSRNTDTPLCELYVVKN